MKTYRQTFVYDPRIGYKFLPNLKVTVVGDERDKMEDYQLVVDKFGYRNNSEEFSLKKRVVLISLEKEELFLIFIFLINSSYI